jgi:Putative lumazine-binding
MRRATIALAAVLAAAATGCGGAADSTGDFSGAEEDVAQVVEDLEKAAGEDEPRRVCTQLLAQATARQLGAGCSRAVEQAFDRSDTFALSVEDVRVSGTTARARVATGRDEDQTEVLELVRERGEWRIRAFGAG